MNGIDYIYGWLQLEQGLHFAQFNIDIKRFLHYSDDCNQNIRFIQ